MSKNTTIKILVTIISIVLFIVYWSYGEKVLIALGAFQLGQLPALWREKGVLWEYKKQS